MVIVIIKDNFFCADSESSLDTTKSSSTAVDPTRATVVFTAAAMESNTHPWASDDTDTTNAIINTSLKSTALSKDYYYAYSSYNAPVNNTPHYPTPVLYRGIDREFDRNFPPRVGEIDMGH